MQKTIKFEIVYHENNVIKLSVTWLEMERRFFVELKNLEEISEIKQIVVELKKVIKKAEEKFGEDCMIDNFNGICQDLFELVVK